MRLDKSWIQDLIELSDGGEPGFLAELVSIFITDSARRIEELRSAVARGDAEAVEMTAHALMGSGFIVGARRIAGLCQGLEAQSRSGSLEGASALVAELADELRGVAWELEELLAVGACPRVP